MRQNLSFAAVGLMFLGGPAFAAPIEDCVAARERKDYPAAQRICQPLADEGMAVAQFQVGFMLFNGLGVPKNPIAAAGWYRKAASQGNADAQMRLGLMYRAGEGVPRDAAEGMKWRSRSAEQGSAYEQFSVGLDYWMGNDVPQNYELGAKWTLRSARQGDGNAQSLLGLMYLNGQGVPLDLVQAHLWLNLAAVNQGSSQSIREQATKGRELAAQSMTPDQIGQAQKLASEWKAKPERQ